MKANRFGFGMKTGQDWCPTCEGPAHFIGGACTDCFAEILVAMLQRHPQLFTAMMVELGRHRKDKHPSGMRARAEQLRARGER